MKTLLIFPPIWDTTQPFIAIPSLTGFLREKGYDVTQWDLNLEFQDKILSSEYIKEILSTKQIKANFTEQILYKALIPDTLSQIDKVKKDLRSEEFYNFEKYLNAKRVIINAFKIVSSAFSPTFVDNRTFRMKYNEKKSEQVILATKDRKENLLIEFYEKNVIYRIKLLKPDLIGISITDYNQIIPALTISRIIKLFFNNIHITLGGFLINSLKDILGKNITKFENYFDSLITGEGELPLLKLINSIEGKESFSEIPNFSYIKNKEFISNENISFSKKFEGIHINDLPTPDFDGFPLNLYFAPEIAFPLRASKGCYWNKCTFCDDIRVYGNFFNQRNSEKVIKDIKKLVEKYNAKQITFTDLAVPARFAIEWAEKIKEENLNVNWLMLARMEKAFTPDLCIKLKEGGCSFIIFGMESGNQRILDLIKKGTKLSNMEKVCKNVHEAGIWNHTFTFLGFPTEKTEEAQDTIDFVMRLSEYIDSVGVSNFILTKDTPIFSHPENFSIKEIFEYDNQDLNNSVGFILEENANEKRLELFDNFVKKLWEKYNQPMWLLEKAQAPVFLYVNHYGQKEMKKIVYPVKVTENNTKTF